MFLQPSTMTVISQKRRAQKHPSSQLPSRGTNRLEITWITYGLESCVCAQQSSVCNGVWGILPLLYLTCKAGCKSIRSESLQTIFMTFIYEAEHYRPIWYRTKFIKEKRPRKTSRKPPIANACWKQVDEQKQRTDCKEHKKHIESLENNRKIKTCPR